jgi:hypothetical protein
VLGEEEPGQQSADHEPEKTEEEVERHGGEPSVWAVVAAVRRLRVRRRASLGAAVPASICAAFRP